MRLSSREKTFLIIGGVALLTVVLWAGVIGPAHDRLEGLAKKTRNAKRSYQKIQELALRFEEMNAKIDSIEKELQRASGFSILSYLDNQAKRDQVRDKVVGMQPKGDVSSKYYKGKTVEIKMKDVELKDLVRYMFNVENSQERLHISEIEIQPRFGNANLLSVRFEVSAYEPAEGT